MKYFLFLLLVINSSLHHKVYSQNDSCINKKRFIPLATIVAVCYTGSLIGLSEVWYKNNPRSSFHFFNDNHEWQQVDKVGHFMTAFQESKYAVDALKWSGVRKKKAVFWGSMAGIILQSPIEYFDGRSKSYGASVGDLSANFAGSAFVLVQHLLWDEIRMEIKFSFHQTSLANQNPGLLGTNLAQNIFKDYNGQTYWLSFNIHSFMREQSKFPKWLNLSLGYGAENMVRADRALSKLEGFDVYRQYYISLDLDLSKIKTRSKAVNFVLYRLNILHIPAPALELNKHGVKLHALYF